VEKSTTLQARVFYGRQEPTLLFTYLPDNLSTSITWPDKLLRLITRPLYFFFADLLPWYVRCTMCETRPTSVADRRTDRIAMAY